MKKLTFAFSLVMASTLFAQTPAAKTGTATRTVAEKKTTTTTVSTTSYSESKMKWGFGFSLWGGTTPTSSSQSLSLMMEFNDLTSLQPFFAIPGTKPNFSFAGGAVLRHTLHGGANNGAHIGLGFNLGTNGSFFANIFPVAGFHFNLGGHVSNLKLSFDVGPMFEVTPTFEFRMLPVGATGGASLHYMF